MTILTHGYKQRGATAVETALIMPVLLLGLLMLFELARIALLVGTGSVALESALQSFRKESYFYDQDVSALRDEIKNQMVISSYGFLNGDNLKIDVMKFDSLHQFGGGPDLERETAADSDEAYQRDASMPPVLSVTVDLSEAFMTPLPGLFGLGNNFKYQYRHLLGNLISEEPDLS